LGYHQLAEIHKEYLEKFFQITPMLPVSGEVIKKATILRQQKKMSLGDALIAATALLYGLTLVTHNVVKGKYAGKPFWGCIAFPD
jgi:predicted nucleic acid-binding protein